MGRAVAIAVALFAFSANAKAPDNGSHEFSAWFESLTNPATGISCCASYDGHVLSDHDWRVSGNSYQVRIAGMWRDVPGPAVLNGISNPTSGAVAFYPRYADDDPNVAPLIYCFVRVTDT